MIIENTRFGTIEVEANKIITMPAGMPGFPGRQRFVILEREETRPFYWYQSVDTPDLAFVILNPYLFEPDYAVDLKPVLREMAWQSDGQDCLKLYVVVNAANGTPEKITANLMGPILINTKRYEAVQMVLPNSPYSHKHPIFSTSFSAG